MLSLRFAKVRRRVQCSIRLLEIETGRSAEASAASPCSVAVQCASTSSFRRPLDLKFPASSISFGHFFFFWRVVYSFFSLLDGPSARSCCSGGPHVCRSTRASASPACFDDEAGLDLTVECLWLRSQDLGNLGKRFT